MNTLDLIEVKLLVDSKVVRETLSRCGIANRRKKILFPTCYLYEKDGKYYICHFKEIFLLTRKNSYDNKSKEDIERRNAICWNLVQWKLVEVVDPTLIEAHKPFIFVLPFAEKKLWKIQHKINVHTLINTTSEGILNA